MTLQGSIQDSLFDCTVTLMRVDSTAVECQPKVYEIGNDAMHISTVFYINVPQRAAGLIESNGNTHRRQSPAQSL